VSIEKFVTDMNAERQKIMKELDSDGLLGFERSRLNRKLAEINDKIDKATRPFINKDMT
jgi:hypothetical protein